MIALIIIAGGLLVLWILAGLGVFLGACARTKSSDTHMSRTGDNKTLALEGERWFFSMGPKTLGITARDGVPLAGYYLENPAGRGIMMMFHGWRSNFTSDFGMCAKAFYGLGFSLFIPCQRACGLSGGRFICFGQKEKLDCADWCRLFAEDISPGSSIILMGVSMGAATVLGAAGENLPSNVRCIISDCAFTSPWEEFSAVARKYLHIGLRPVLLMSSLFARLLAGFSFRGEDTRSALSRSRLPVLFIHGETDDFVPLRFTLQNFDAARGEKELITFPGAGHAGSFASDSERYMAAAAAFLSKYV